VLLYLFKAFFTKSDYKKYGKCQRKGYYIALGGEKDKCDACQGSEKIIS